MAGDAAKSGLRMARAATERRDSTGGAVWGERVRETESLRRGSTGFRERAGW